MQHWSSIILSAFAITGVLAAPTGNNNYDKEIRVILSGSEVGSQTTFNEGYREEKRPVGSNGPFSTVELALGKNVNPQSYRCKMLDKHHSPIVVVRGQNIDTTFADGDKGAWTLQAGAQEVSKIICDPTFVANPQQPTPPPQNGDTKVTVALSGPSELATQTVFEQVGAVGGSETKQPTGSKGPYNQVQLRLGADVKDTTLRCQLKNEHGKIITLKRGDNIQETFADGNPWTFLDPQESNVGWMECNDQFKLQ